MLGTLVEKPILAIDWDVRTLRVVHARSSKKSVDIEQVLSIAIPDDVDQDDPDSMGKFIRAALTKAGITTRRALFDISRDHANIYPLMLPPATLNDLAGMVQVQIPRELPFPVEQAAIDFAVSPELEGEKRRVMVAAVQQETLDHFTRIFDVAGLKLGRVGLRPNANQFAVNAMLEPTPADYVLFVDVGPVTTEITMLRRGQLVFSRAAAVSIPVELDTPTYDQIEYESEIEPGEGEPDLRLTPETSEASLAGVVRELAIEVTRSIEAYRVTDADADVGHVVIGGSCDIEGALADAIQQQYNITAQPYNPATSFGWSADEGAEAGAFASTFGMVIGQSKPDELKFNLVDPKKPVSVAQQRMKRAPVAVVTGVAAVAAIVVGYINFIQPLHEENANLTKLRNELKKELDEHDDFRKLVSVLDDYEDRRVVWLDELHDVLSTGVLADNKSIVFNQIDMSLKRGRIALPFRAAQGAVPNDAVKDLEAVTEGEKKKRKYDAVLGPTTNKAGEKYPVTGQLQIELVGKGGGKKKR